MAMAMLASCGGAKTQNTESAKAVESESVANDSKDIAYTDLEFFELRGPVKSLKIGDYVESDNFTIYEFTGDGKLYTVDGDKTMFTRNEAERVCIDEESGDFAELPIFKRDKDGNICTIEYVESATEYTWKNGRVESYKWFCEGTEGKVTYTYDANGDIKTSCESYEDGDSDESCVEYKITKRDSHGNWIEREVICDDSFVEMRAIEYYE